MAVSVRSFAWCGSNSIFRRAQAAGELKAELETTAPGEPILIIGHSHGGNVVLQATSGLPHTANMYVCTLATPFLRLFESERRFAGARMILTLVSVAFCMFGGGFLGVTFHGGRFVVAGICLVCFILGWRGGDLLFKLLINPLPKTRTPTAWQLRSRLLCEATVSDARSLKDRLLILRGIDDEAALSLAAGALANRLLRVIYGSVVKVWGAAFIPKSDKWYWVLFLPVMVSAPISFVVAGSLLLFGPVAAMILYAAMFVVPVVAIFLVPLTRTVFGRELAVGSMSCDAFFDSVPDSDQAAIITLSLRKDSTLSHSLYDHPRAAATIASWMADQFSRKVAVYRS
ncbi:hypothetical protein NLM32_24535 [Bradyrhizobium sp. CCGUVB14]|nr:hypothetical protein [Bradyrhizobium sp. CCGUVB14]MCP3444203.1 hypothetical protein [Bradyrhizobium sp. CCGUVB14]